MEWKKEHFTISDDKSLFDIDYIFDFISNRSYWAANIPFEVVKKSIEGSVCFGVFENKQQIGFARVITDSATFGYLADVFIDENYRGQGLGKWLMETIMAYSNFQGLRGWMLRTKDAHSLYEKYGFERVVDTCKLMTKFNSNVYAKKELGS
jgi:GNAT superfamily N-acetyltransferase